MKLFFDDLLQLPKVKEAMAFVSEKHAGHTYGNMDYVYGHLMAVAKHAYDVIPTETVFIAALLHDVVEDAGVSIETISEKFGERIAHIVWCVSDEPGPNRKTRKLNTYWKIRSDDIALLIKLCDRLHNVCGEEKREMYRKEHYTFRAALWEPDSSYEVLWETIEEILFDDVENWIRKYS